MQRSKDTQSGEGLHSGPSPQSVDPMQSASWKEMESSFSRSEAIDLRNASSPAAHARAAIVNRTHRVVRERAEAMQKRRTSARDLVVPLLICSVLLIMVCYAVWIVVSNNFGFAPLATSVGSEIEAEAGRMMSGQTIDSGGSVYILLMWFLPVSIVTLATILFRRTRGRTDDQVTR